MKWENLQSFTCPHCDEPLQKGTSTQDEITCINCQFHIPPSRYKSILTHRATPGVAVVRMRWQSLHAQRCPICQNMLKPEERNAAILRCITSTCTFRIHDERLKEIMADPEHPTNRFKHHEIPNQ